MLLRMMFLYGENNDNNLRELFNTHISKPIQYFSFNGNEYRGRGRLCHAIVKYHIEQHPDATIEELRKTFDTNAKYKKGHVYFVDSIESAEKVFNSQNIAGGNYYMSKNDQIKTNDGNVVVWGYWPDRFFKNFEKKLKDLNYDFKEK